MLGKINGGNSLIKSFLSNKRKTIPTKIFNSWVHHNNILQYLGVHYIDIIRFVTKAKPKRVMAIGQKTFLENLGFESNKINCINFCSIT